ncbi:MAG: SDR family oxidoreductase [Cyanobacteriota bacterium]|nr:SDR family oxidoreductase [Cyanobacteriota bacterium]
MSPNPDLVGKRVLVTGASSGIGLSIARAFLDNNCKVALNGRRSEVLDQITAHNSDAFPASGDVTIPSECDQIIAKAIAELGGIDILVCNVGSGKISKSSSKSLDVWKEAFEVNLWSTINIIESATSHLELSHGKIICISSICGIERIKGAPVQYSCAKAALNAFVKNSSHDFATKQITINAVAPGNILFPGSTWEKKLSNDPEGVQRMLDSEVPLARLGMVEDIANLVLYLSTNHANFVTGSIWTVDGGQCRSW